MTTNPHMGEFAIFLLFFLALITIGWSMLSVVEKEMEKNCGMEYVACMNKQHGVLSDNCSYLKLPSCPNETLNIIGKVYT